MVVKKKRKHIKHIRIEQKGKVDMASYCVMVLQEMVLKAFVTSIFNTTQSRWTSKKTWTPRTTISQPPLIATPN
jgi:hypothetical protein